MNVTDLHITGDRYNDVSFLFKICLVGWPCCHLSPETKHHHLYGYQDTDIASPLIKVSRYRHRTFNFFTVIWENLSLFYGFINLNKLTFRMF